MPRPGNSAATWGTTQPWRGEGIQPGLAPATLAPSTGAHLRSCGGSRRLQQVAGGEVGLGGTHLADSGTRQRATGVDVGKGRAAADAVEACHRAIAVIADRHPPAPLENQVTNSVAIVPHVHRQEAHTSTVARVDVIDHVLLIGAVATAGKPKREHQRAVEEVADTNRADGVDLAGGGATSTRRTGKLRRLAIVLSDVGVAFELLPGGGGHSERRQRPAGWLLVETQDSLVITPDRAEEGDQDQGHEDRAHRD